MIGIIILLGILEASGTYYFVSKSSEQSVSTIDYGFWSSLFTAILLWSYMGVQLLLAEDAAMQIQNTDVGPILFFMFLAGMASMVFAVAKLKAMQIGTKSLTSAIANTALALSTIFFVVVWKNTITIFGIIGIILMLLSVILMGFTGKENGKINRSWIILCICALFFNTLGIILTTVPSQYNMKDAIGLRGASVITFLALFYFILKRCMYIKTNKLAIRIAAVSSLITAIVQTVSYPLLDKLAEKQMTYIFTPVKLVTSIVFFSVITSIRFNEKMEKIQFVGIIICLTGILLFMV
ncbi:MAG: EamA family transporter [Lachnospiraceae bacterium]|nr:EamA family transporter [Lachnospiraceae bacterium]